MIKIKICGIKTEAQALGAAAAGADFVGMVFARSPRQITPAQANNIVTALKKLRKTAPEIVGVFVNTPAREVNRIAESCGMDWVQLSGDEDPEYCREIARPVIKVLRVTSNCQPEQVCRDLEGWKQSLASQPYLFLLDAYDREKYGGTGRPLDWSTAGEIAKSYRLIIAGGLTPENVSEAVRTARPWGVDVSSGVETEGEKDMNKIEAFLKAVRSADGDQT